MSPPFRKLTERELYRGTLISVARGRFAAPDGQEFERDLVHHPGAVSVVPLDGDAGGDGAGDGSGDDGGDVTVLLVRQYRAGVDQQLLEIPAGKRDVAGEPVELTASRELEEEVGMRAGRLDLLAEFFNSPGFCDEHSFVFLARELAPSAASYQGIEEQHLTVERVRLDDVPALIASGELIDAKSIIGLCLAREVLRAEGRAAT